MSIEVKAPQYVRMTCEQLDKLKQVAKLNETQTGIYWKGLPIVTRGSIRDCNLREARPRVPCLDITKDES